MEPCLDLNSIDAIAPRFSLLLFMVSRNHIKLTKFNKLRKYIRKNIYVYKKYIQNELSNAKKCLHSCTKVKDLKYIKNGKRNILSKSWHLPPNLYDTIKIPYENKRGIGGAYWPKKSVDLVKPHLNLRQPYTRFYNLPTTSEQLFTVCQRDKGVFLSNARERRPTSRCMISNIATCYKNPSEPGPTTYNPTSKVCSFLRMYSLRRPNPHLFYRQSIVPIKNNSIHKPHTSFTAAPGRYEIRYCNICPCSSRLIYQPQLDLIIENEKRKKFRRLSYEKIKAKNYTSPDWGHVKGQGFRFLFKGAKRIKPMAFQEVKKLKNIKLYPDSKYIALINNPKRIELSLRSKPVLSLYPHIKFNCATKKITRKQLRNNKKIAFNSSQERFRDSYRLPILTQKQQEQVKQSLPLERQFRDHPVMEKRISEIKFKIYETPQKMLSNYEPKLRKKVFKFQPLPEAKVLVTENNANINEANKGGYFLKPLEAKCFFRDGIQL